MDSPNIDTKNRWITTSSSYIATNSGARIPGGDVERKSTMKTTHPRTAAEVIVDGMEKDQFRVLIGNDAKMMDFFYRLAPQRAVKLILEKMKSLLG